MYTTGPTASSRFFYPDPPFSSGSSLPRACLTAENPAAAPAQGPLRGLRDSCCPVTLLTSDPCTLLPESPGVSPQPSGPSRACLLCLLPGLTGPRQQAPPQRSGKGEKQGGQGGLQAPHPAEAVGSHDKAGGSRHALGQGLEGRSVPDPDSLLLKPSPPMRVQVPFKHPAP